MMLIFRKKFQQTKTHFFFFLGIFALIGGLFYLFYLKNEEIRVEGMSFGKADVGIEGFSFLQNKEGKVEWEVNAKRAEVFKDKNAVFLKEVRATFSPSNNEEWIKLEGGKGQIDTQAKDFILEQENGGVKVFFSNGITVLTRRLGWSNRQNEIFSKEDVHIYGPGFEIRGRGFTADVRSQKIRIHNRVRALMNSSPDT